MVWKLKSQILIHWLTRIFLPSFSLSLSLSAPSPTQKIIRKKILEFSKKKKIKTAGL